MTSAPILIELTSLMGQALFKIQNAERVLKLALHWAGADPDVTLAGLCLSVGSSDPRWPAAA